jgi:hypothetical protein
MGNNHVPADRRQDLEGANAARQSNYLSAGILCQAGKRSPDIDLLHLARMSKNSFSLNESEQYKDPISVVVNFLN